MKNFGVVKSTVKPSSLAIDDSSVWISSNITEITEPVGEDTFTGYQYELIQYSKDEYIQLLDTQMTNTQLALVDVYELVTSTTTA
ncbi:hypothetical protein [Oscillibacter sp.]|uniref:hypothetical protein n=1 Tax=Oscillibacter sp. TaxID=1945593 RepID=UPI0026221898|nr:hypothetical protein [Oscillibacter sp.]MDD3347325.1 hypothetical protein [Oscillibacter sp.]